MVPFRIGGFTNHLGLDRAMFATQQLHKRVTLAARDIAAEQPTAIMEHHGQKAFNSLVRRSIQDAESQVGRQHRVWLLKNPLSGRVVERQPDFLRFSSIPQAGDLNASCGQQFVAGRQHMQPRILLHELGRIVEYHHVVFAPKRFFGLPHCSCAHQRVAHRHLHVAVQHFH